MSPLAAIVECSAAALAGPGGRLLCIHGEPVASIPEPDHLAALVARVAPEASLPDLTGALIAPRPSGVLVLGSQDGSFGLALSLSDGRVVSAAGPDSLQSMGTWVVEFHRRAAQARSRSNWGEDAAFMRALEPGRTFVAESVLEALRRCDHPGATLLLLQGTNLWLHETLGQARAPDLSFLLMEHARRADELAGIESALAAETGVIVPLSRPAERPAVRPCKQAGSDWDFFDDPDPAAETEWQDARFVFDFCDGSTGLPGLIERTMLGRFRTASAVLALVERKHVQVVGDEYADFICDLAS